jgi:hypothetical protein
MAKKTFSKDYLIDELELPQTAIENHITGQSGWTVEHEIIFKEGEKHYSTYYEIGATERQDEGPWEYEDDIECEEVELKEVTVKKWVPVD